MMIKGKNKIIPLYQKEIALKKLGLKHLNDEDILAAFLLRQKEPLKDFGL